MCLVFRGGFVWGWASQTEGDIFPLVVHDYVATNKVVFNFPYEIDGFGQKESVIFLLSTAKFVNSARLGKQFKNKR